MSLPQTDATSDPQNIVAVLQQRLDAALSEKAALAEALALRNSEFGERIENQAATLDVLKAMSASPGDPQPVFDLIVRHATELCNVPTATLFEYDGHLVHIRSSYLIERFVAATPLAACSQLFPMRPTRGSISCRAILDRQIVHIRDLRLDSELAGFIRELGHRSQVSVPLIRDGLAIGAISIGTQAPGGFSDSQIALLQTFAEQAVIAITGAETYRALQTRTSDLQETLEYQTVTSDVLKVISQSTFDLQPVLDTVVQTAARLCEADQAVIVRREGETVWLGANCGFPPEYEAAAKALGVFPLDRNTPAVAHRALIEGRTIHIHDVAAVPGYPDIPIRLGKQRTSLAMPLLRESVPIGVILLARQRVEPFTDRQIELISTFADQAVIAIENTRLITEQREALEQQTAMSEVLEVINTSPGDLAPVFEVILEKAHRICKYDMGSLATYDGTFFRAVATRGYGNQAEVMARTPYRPLTAQRALLRGDRLIHIPDMQVYPVDPDDAAIPAFVTASGFRACLMVPLRKDGTLLGFLTGYRKVAGPFSEKQIVLLENFAAQAVIAMENARLITEQREALEQQTATAEVLQVINASPGNLAPVFDAMLEKAMRLCEAAFGSLVPFDGEYFQFGVTRGMSSGLVDALRKRGPVRPSASIAYDQIARGADIVHIPDITDPLLPPPPSSPNIHQDGARTTLFVALRGDDALLGVFIIFRKEVRPFSDKQIALVKNFAAQAVIAMENARLLTEQREALEQQTATAEVLQVINANPGNLTPVFEAILDKAHTLCGAAIGSLVLFDGTYFRAVATHGWPNSITALFSEPAGPNRARQRLVDGERFVQVADIRAIGRGPNSAWGDAVVESTDARTMLLVPLSKDGALLGFISAFRPEVRVFSDKQIALLENFAAQAVIAMENARLLTEQREALEQQTATAEVLQVINQSPGDLQPVFDAMLEKAIRLCDSAFGVFNTFDGQYFHPVASRGLDPRLAEFLSRPVRPEQGSSSYRLVQGEDLVHVADITADEAYRLGIPSRRAVADLGGARTQLLVALRQGNALIGMFNIFRQEVRPFTDRQVALLENFTAQAVIAMENARLLNEQREALERQTATAEVLEVINASPGDLVPVFDAIVERAATLCEADEAAVRTFDGSVLNLVATHAPAGILEELERLGPSHPDGLYEAIAQGASVTHLVDVWETEAFLTNARARERLELRGIRSWLAVALRKEGALLGVINVHRREVRPFTEKQVALLENFAAQAVIAMENARLINEQREALEQQTATAEVLQVINASPGNLTPVFDAMLEKAIRLCDAAFGNLAIFDGTAFKVVANHYGFEYSPTATPIMPEPGSALGRVVNGERVVHILDLVDTDAYRQRIPSRVVTVERLGARTALWVALYKDNAVVGVFVIFRREVRAFSEKEITLLGNFAAQAVIAMENARLLDELRARTDELAQRQAELRVTFENMGDGVAMFNETQQLVAWNRKFQEIFDLPDALLGQHRTYEEHLRFLAARGDFGPGVDTVEQIDELVASTGQAYGYERTRPDGRVIEIRRNPVPDGGFVLIFSDITERKRSEVEIRAARDAAETALCELRTAQANLIQAEKMASLGQLTAGIAHEIKNPLNFVNNFSALSTELIDELREVLAPEPLGETARTEVDDLTALLKGNLEKVVQHGQRADGIVRSMLDHSRGSSGERRMVDLNVLIDEALNLAYHGARAQDQSFNITLERDFGEGIAPIEVNPQDITRVFLNLFANGFYATTRRAREGGDARFVPTLKVTTHDTGDAVEIRVWDNGIGIPADIRDKLFQPFFTTKPTGEGTGLGLSISYDIITQQHGGSIAVDSKVGEYSEFTIRLPRNS